MSERKVFYSDYYGLSNKTLPFINVVLSLVFNSVELKFITLMKVIERLVITFPCDSGLLLSV